MSELLDLLRLALLVGLPLVAGSWVQRVRRRECRAGSRPDTPDTLSAAAENPSR